MSGEIYKAFNIHNSDLDSFDISDNRLHLSHNEFKKRGI